MTVEAVKQPTHGQPVQESVTPAPVGSASPKDKS